MSKTRSGVLLISDFTVAGLGPFLKTGDAPHLDATSAPFDQVRQTLLDGDGEPWKSSPEFAVVWTRPHAAIRSFARVLRYERVAIDDVLAEVDAFAASLRAAASRVSGLLVPAWTWAPYDRGLGLLNLDPGIGPAYVLARMNLRLAEALAGDSNIHVLDAARWVALAGAAATSPKLWHLGKIAFSPEVF